MARLSKEKRECTEAYEKFERERYIYGLKISCIPEPPHKYDIDNYGLPVNDRKFKVIDLPKISTCDDDEGNPVLAYFSNMTTHEEAQAVLGKRKRSS